MNFTTSGGSSIRALVTPPEDASFQGDVVLDLDEADRYLCFQAIEPVDVSVEALNVDLDVSPSSVNLMSWLKKNQELTESKQILKHVNAHTSAGTITAILGASGSGKTSLLNALSHRTESSRLTTTGRILYNGSAKLSSVRSAYVMQSDILIPTLTVRETLQYAAELRLPPPTTSRERRRVVEQVILELGLKDCANTRIGGSEYKGCSGGEKRRCSLAVQMLANPSLLFLDEVTTGLDASTAYQLVLTLKNLARMGRNIIITIHQPRSEIWSLFDNILLLATGSVLYSGRTEDCLPYFESIGYCPPEMTNPAEYLIDQAAIDSRSCEAEAKSLARVRGFIQAWTQNSRSLQQAERHELQEDKVFRTKEDGLASSQHAASPTMIVCHAGFIRQLVVLTRRNIKVTRRDPYGLIGSLVVVILNSSISGWIFYQLDGSLQGIRSREGSLFICTALQSYLILMYEVFRLTNEISTFDREYGENVIAIPAWIISRRLARLFLEDILIPLIYSVIFYFMAGFRPLASQFFTFFSVLLLLHHISVNLATVCVALARDFAVASLYANTIFTLQTLGGGFLVQPNQIPVWVRWLKWTAFTFYSYSAVTVNEFIAYTSDPAGRLYDCPHPGGTSNPACNQWTGRYIMNVLEIPFSDVRRPIVIMLAFMLAFLLGSGVIFWLRPVHLGISRARKTDTDFSAGKERMSRRSLKEAHAITIQLHSLKLDIRKRGLKFWKPKILSILKPLNTEFAPGQLNVIMGPSGSGKTSLLNVMAQRLPNSTSTTHLCGGRMTFNGALPSEKVVRSVSAYVCQDDEILLPYLSVIENLRFAAALRLPSHLSKEEKNERAESVLVKLGLRDCANTLVGSDLVKGISGGERRRTTIAVQILTDPKILFLDEPTSGLDAFTASSIIKVLRGLAKEGRTLVLTIHQARSDVFKCFNSILLLAKGGSLVYSGKASKVLPYFAALGHTCPNMTNPADFCLDLISINNQSAFEEAKAKAKVRSLILAWNVTRANHNRTTLQLTMPAELASLGRKMTPLKTAFPVLMHRSFINFRRNKVAVIARTAQVSSLAIIIALFYAPLGHSQSSMLTRLGLLQEFTSLYFVGMLQCVAVYPNERDVFYREHDDIAFSVEAFFLQYTLAEIPFEVFTALLFAVIANLTTQLPRTPELFFIVAFNAFAFVSCGESLGIVFNTLFSHTGFAVNVTSVFLSVASTMAGIMSLNIPGFLQAFNHLSPLKWALGNLVPYTFQGVIFTCGDDQKLPNGQCPIRNGEDVMRQFNFETTAWLNLLALGICVVAYRAAAYAVLKAKKSRWRSDWSWGWLT